MTTEPALKWWRTQTCLQVCVFAIGVRVLCELPKVISCRALPTRADTLMQGEWARGRDVAAPVKGFS